MDSEIKEIFFSLFVIKVLFYGHYIPLFTHGQNDGFIFVPRKVQSTQDGGAASNFII
jgi:hypothetical protein